MYIIYLESTYIFSFELKGHQEIHSTMVNPLKATYRNEYNLSNPFIRMYKMKILWGKICWISKTMITFFLLEIKKIWVISPT